MYTLKNLCEKNRKVQILQPQLLDYTGRSRIYQTEGANPEVAPKPITWPHFPKVT